MDVVEDKVEDKVMSTTFQALRSLSGWSREELATRAGVSKSTVDKFEGGIAKDPKFSTIRSILAALGLKLADWEQLTLQVDALHAKVERVLRGEPPTALAAEIAEPPPEPSNEELSNELGRAQARYNLRLLELMEGRQQPDG